MIHNRGKKFENKQCTERIVVTLHVLISAWLCVHFLMERISGDISSFTKQKQCELTFQIKFFINILKYLTEKVATVI